ncbi:hypothetical protein EDC04DRAFT_2580454 [Pisolithus marmoratus]|nr:hypothetical protein EDC04DRAFT_2580454 [Pisolithus marmoratus]
MKVYQYHNGFIFIGELSWNVDNDWLAQEFSSCGGVESATIQMDRITGRSHRFGYVHFKSMDAVEKVLAMDGKEIDGRAIRANRSNSPDKKASADKHSQTVGDKQSPASSILFVGNLGFGITEDGLWETFGEYGDVKNVRRPMDRETGKVKGFAYVEFSDVEAAKKAYDALNSFEFDGQAVWLDISQPRDAAGGRGGSDRGGHGGHGSDQGWGGRGGRGGCGGRGGGRFDRGRRGGGGFDRGGRGGGGGRGQGRGGAWTGNIAVFEGQKITF